MRKHTTTHSEFISRNQPSPAGYGGQEGAQRKQRDAYQTVDKPVCGVVRASFGERARNNSKKNALFAAQRSTFYTAPRKIRAFSTSAYGFLFCDLCVLEPFTSFIIFYRKLFIATLSARLIKTGIPYA